MVGGLKIKNKGENEKGGNYIKNGEKALKMHLFGYKLQNFPTPPPAVF